MIKGVKQVYRYLVTLTRVALVLLIALSVPKLGMLYVQSRMHASGMHQYTKFKLGVENISKEFLCSLTPKGDLSYSVGLITNQSGKDQAGKRTLDILLQHGVNVKKVFAPEHGVHGNVQDHSKQSCDIKDVATGTQIVTLYDKWTTKVLDENLLKDIDVLMFDIQEMGMRHNTYLTTLFQSLEAAARHKKTFVIFDRPNVLGSCMEGPLVENELKSAISYAPIPLRHGMTIGELASYFNKYCLQKKVALHIVPMENYNRYVHTEQVQGLPLSPNITSLNACYGYSFLGMLAEVRPFDVAIGTEKSFQCISLPDSIKFAQKKWYELLALLKDHGIDAKFHRYYSARKKQHCSGLLLKIQDVNAVASFKCLLSVLHFFKKSGVKLEFSRHFDKAVGTKKVREFLEGAISKYELELAVNNYLHDFFKKASMVFQYRPHPYVIRL